MGQRVRDQREPVSGASLFADASARTPQPTEVAVCGRPGSRRADAEQTSRNIAARLPNCAGLEETDVVGPGEVRRSRGGAPMSTRDLLSSEPALELLRLPDTPFELALPGELAALAADPDRYADACVQLLELARGGERPPTAGFRAAHLIALLGQWRHEPALPALVDWLGTPWGFGGMEVVHALTRIGGAAVEPTLYTLFDPVRPPLERQRAARALASIGVAALDFDADPRWGGAASARYGEVVAALRVIVERGATEPREVLTEATEGLCHLRHAASWPQIERLFLSGAVADTDTFGVRVARALIKGAAVDLRFGGFGAPMVAGAAGG